MSSSNTKGDNLIQRYALICPTRGRSNRIKEFVESALITATHPKRIEILLYVDNDDPDLQDYESNILDLQKKFINSPISITLGPSIGVPKAANTLFEQSKADVFLTSNDDQIFITYGWDTRLDDEITKFPDNIQETLEKLMVNRRGKDPHSYMMTESIVGYISPQQCYRLDAHSLTPIETSVKLDISKVEPEVPPHVRFTGDWRGIETVDSIHSNILGGLGTLTLNAYELNIPEADPTPEFLSFYDARLFRVGDLLTFECDQNLPVTIINIGQTYVEDYLHIKDQGGGSFIEYHDRPHLHMPLESKAHGHLLLGRSEGDDYLLSAFPIPFGYAIYTKPFALHADPYLVGRDLLIY